MKEIFTYNRIIDKNAYLNWRIDRHSPISNMINIAEGFIKTSIREAERLVEDNNDNEADILIFPILFNANHAIELYVKSILWCLNILLENDKKMQKHHNIKQIFQEIKARVRDYEPEIEKNNTFDELTENLSEYLDELYGKIEIENIKGKKEVKIDFSRYPFDNDYINHFYVETFDNVVVDLENYVIRFKEIADSLRQISNHLYYDCVLGERD